MALTDVKSEQIQSSVALAGSPTTTTQSASDNSTKIATTAYVETAVANLVASAPAALNTLDELAAALNDDASFSTTITNSIATKLPLAGGTLTGNLTTSGNLLINAASGNPYLSIKTAGTGNNPYVEYRAGNNIVFDNMLVASASTDYWRVGYGASGTVTSEYLTVTSGGNVGINTNIPAYPLHIEGSNVSSGGGLATLGVYDTGTAYNGTNPGGGVTFRGKYNTAGALTNFATVQGIKENTTDGNYASALRFTTRANGANLTEQMRIDSSGNVGIGNSSPSSYYSTFRDLVIGDGSGDHGITIATGTSGAGTLAIADGTSGNTAYRGYFQYSNNTDKLFLGAGGGSKLTIQGIDGNVGINDTSPDRKLSIIGDSTSNGQYPLSLDATNTDYALEFRRSGTSEWWIKASASNFTVHENGVGDQFTVYSGSAKVHGILGVNKSANPSVGLSVGSDASTTSSYGLEVTNSSANTRFLVDGVGNSYFYKNDNNVGMKFDASNGRLGIGTGVSALSYALTVSGESSLGDFSANGFANLGRNADGNQDITTLGGYGVLSGGTRYGRYGVLRFRSSANYTGSSRGYMITNGYGANKFAILQSTSATTMPDIASAGGGVNNGQVPFMIDNAGRVSQALQPYFEVYRSGAQSGYNAASSPWTSVVIYNSTTANLGGHYNTSTGFFTAPIDGIYYFIAAAYCGFTCGQAWFSSTSGRIAGTDMVLAGMGQFPSAWIILNMSANDTVGFHPYSSSTTSGTIYANGNHTYFRGYFLG